MRHFLLASLLCVTGITSAITSFRIELPDTANPPHAGVVSLLTGSVDLIYPGGVYTQPVTIYPHSNEPRVFFSSNLVPEVGNEGRTYTKAILKMTGRVAAHCEANAGFTINDTQSISYTVSPKGGDVNQDGLVDIADYSLLALAFDGVYNDSPYNKDADFNYDGIIDIADYSILALSFDYVGDLDPYFLFSDHTAKLAAEIRAKIAVAVQNSQVVVDVPITDTYYVLGRILISSQVSDNTTRHHVHLPVGKTIKFTGSGRITGSIPVPVNNGPWIETGENTNIWRLNTSRVIVPNGVWFGGWQNSDGNLWSTFSQPDTLDVTNPNQPMIASYTDGSGQIGMLHVATDKGIGLNTGTNEVPWNRTLGDIANTTAPVPAPYTFEHGALANGIAPRIFSEHNHDEQVAVGIFPEVDSYMQVHRVTSITYTSASSKYTVFSDGLFSADPAKSILHKGTRFRYLNEPSHIDQAGEYAFTKSKVFVKWPTGATTINLSMPRKLAGNDWLSTTSSGSIANAPLHFYDVDRVEFEGGIKFDTGVGSAIDALSVGALKITNCHFKAFGQPMVVSRQGRSSTFRDTDGVVKVNTAGAQQPHCLMVTGSTFTDGWRMGVLHDKGRLEYSNSGTTLDPVFQEGGYTSSWFPDEQAGLVKYKDVTAYSARLGTDFDSYNVRFEGNTLSGFGQVFANSPATMLFRGTSHCNYQGNTISDTAYSALHYQGAYFKIHGNTFERCVSDNTDNAAVYAVVSLVDIGNEIYNNHFKNIVWYPEFNSNGFFPKSGSPPTVAQSLPPLGDDGQRLPGKTIVAGIYLDNGQSGQKAYDNLFENNQYGIILLSGRYNSLASGLNDNEFTGGTQPYWAERVGELVSRKEIAPESFEAVVHSDDELSNKKVWQLRGANVFRKLLGNFYNGSGNLDRPTSGVTGIHSLYYGNSADIYNYWPQTGGTFTANYVNKYLIGLPSESGDPFWWGKNPVSGPGWPEGARLPLSQNQSYTAGMSSQGLLERGWLMLDRRTNSLTEGAGSWQVKQEDNIFFTGNEANFGTTGRTYRGQVVWRTGDNLQFALPSGSDPGDKSSHYIYLWHTDLGSPEAIVTGTSTTYIPSTKKAIRTLLDKDGRFAMHVPVSWTQVYVKTEQSLWRRINVNTLGTGEYSPPDDTREDAFWENTNVWRELKLAYGDMDGDNRIEYWADEDYLENGRIHPNSTDWEQYLARRNAAVHVTQVDATTGTKINHYHLHVDLTRNRTVGSTDEDILESYPQMDVWGARL